MSVKSAIHFWLGRSASNCRSSASGATAACGPLSFGRPIRSITRYSQATNCAKIATYDHRLGKNARLKQTSDRIVMPSDKSATYFANSGSENASFSNALPNKGESLEFTIAPFYIVQNTVRRGVGEFGNDVMLIQYLLFHVLLQRTPNFTWNKNIFSPYSRPGIDSRAITQNLRQKQFPGILETELLGVRDQSSARRRAHTSEDL